MGQRNAIFVGGTRRSGSTVAGYLIGSHPEAWCTLPRELRFLTDADGLLDLVLGKRERVHPQLDPNLRGLAAAKARLQLLRSVSESRRPTSLADFERGMYGLWWNRSSPEGEPRGLHRGLTEAHLRESMERFTSSVKSAPIPAANALIHNLIDPAAAANGAQHWADTTPQNAENAHRILRVDPSARVVFMIRDGRDTVASVIEKSWGPNDFMTGLEWWRTGALRATRSMSKLNASQGLTIQLRRLIESDREESLQRLFEFLELDITSSVREFFDTRMRPSFGHTHRWKQAVPSEIQHQFETRYEEIWHELSAAGVDLPEFSD